MDSPLARPSVWRRYAPYAIGALAALSVGTWLLAGVHGHVYRVPVDKVTLGTVTQGSFEDFIAVRATAAPFITNYLTADQGGTVKQVMAEDGATVKAGQPLIVLTNATLQLQVASREADTAGQINALENTKLQLEDARFKYEHDLLDIEHQIAKLKGDLARDKVLLNGNAIAPATYHQEEAEYAYELKLRDATVASRDTEQKVRENQLNQLQETLAHLNDSMATAEASLDALTIHAATDGRLTALDAEVGQSKAQGAVLGQVDSLDRFKLNAQVDEFYLGRVVLGQIALFSIDGRDYEANVAKIYPQIANGTFKVDLHFEDPSPQSLHTGPSGGEYWFGNQNIAGYSETQLAELRKNTIGFVFQSFNLIDELNVSENVEIALLYHREVSAGERKSRVHEALEHSPDRACPPAGVGTSL
jgi:HlyD family secretion protein